MALEFHNDAYISTIRNICIWISVEYCRTVCPAIVMSYVATFLLMYCAYDIIREYKLGHHSVFTAYRVRSNFIDTQYDPHLNISRYLTFTSMQVKQVVQQIMASRHISTEFKGMIKSCLMDPVRYGSNFKSVCSEHILRVKLMSISCEIAPRWIPLNAFEDRSELIQVMARRPPARSQCWPRSMSHMASLGLTEFNIVCVLSALSQ